MDLDRYMSGRLVTAEKFSTTVTVTGIQIYHIQSVSVRPLSAKMFLGILNLALRQSRPPTRLERLRMLKFWLQILETPVQIIIQVIFLTVFIRVLSNEAIIHLNFAEQIIYMTIFVNNYILIMDLIVIWRVKNIDNKRFRSKHYAVFFEKWIIENFRGDILNMFAIEGPLENY